MPNPIESAVVQTPGKTFAPFQMHFHRRWKHLNDPHVRALAWLLDAPDLLDPACPEWHGKIASLSTSFGQDERDWLAALDAAPAPLHAYLDNRAFTRLGRYAEKLMAYYFQHQGKLLVQGLQVRQIIDGKNQTIGEFDFLLQSSEGLLHWELASKFYLLRPGDWSLPLGKGADYFIGPNLVDTLGAKIRKILDRQLLLSRHPAAQIHLPQPVVAAQALIKGWLFYHYKQSPQPKTQPETQMLGLSPSHCRGFWCELEDMAWLEDERFVILPRLAWLAPAKADLASTIDMRQLHEVLDKHFEMDSMPVLLAVMQACDGQMLEASRGFIVPNGWLVK